LPDWNELFESAKFRWRKPHPSVVDLVHEMEKRGLHRVLDLGCGAGRHTIYLSASGFEVVGMDPAQVGLVHSAKGLIEHGLPRRLVRAGMDHLPFPDESFHCVISIYVIHHNDIRGIKRAMGEIERVLLPDGLVLAMVLSRGDFKHGDGREIEEETFITASGAESGVPHHFFSREEVAERFKNFETLRLVPEHRNRDLPDGTSVHHEHWEVLGIKR
jgi:ubiquinone/menaquinone biosynthesis C-methylase UbiE